MKKYFLAALMSVSAISSAHAIENVGLFNGTGFLVNGYQSTPNKTRANVLVVYQDGRTESVVVVANCAAKNFTLISANKQATVPYSTKRELTRKSPTVGGYYAVYEKFCPTKPVPSKKCAMTDSGKLCGKELQMYQMHD